MGGTLEPGRAEGWHGTTPRCPFTYRLKRAGNDQYIDWCAWSGMAVRRSSACIEQNPGERAKLRRKKKKTSRQEVPWTINTYPLCFIHISQCCSYNWRHVPRSRRGAFCPNTQRYKPSMPYKSLTDVQVYVEETWRNIPFPLAMLSVSSDGWPWPLCVAQYIWGFFLISVWYVPKYW